MSIACPYRNDNDVVSTKRFIAFMASCSKTLASAGPLGAAFPAPTYAEQCGTTNFFAVPHSNGHRLRSPSISTFYTGFFLLCYIVLSTFLDRHGQNMDKFNRSQLPNCQSVLRQVTLAAGSGGSTEAFVAFVAVAFVLVVFAASQRTSEEAKVGVTL